MWSFLTPVLVSWLIGYGHQSSVSVSAFGNISPASLRLQQLPASIVSASSISTGKQRKTVPSTILAAEAATSQSVSEPRSGGSSTMPKSIFNLVKSIVGAGVLSLPSGIAAFSNNPSALIPATALIGIIGILSGYGFSLIGRVCHYTDSKSYREAWEKTIDKDTSIIPAAACTFKTTAAILAYSMILADTFKALLSTVGMDVSRSITLLSVTTLILFPLCLLKNLSSLAPFSLLGVAGMGYTTVAMSVRYFGKAYSLTAPTTAFLADLTPALRPSFGDIGAQGVFSPSAFILICMLSTAYMAHFNSPRFLNELQDNTLPRFNTVVSASFGISIALFAAIASLGFLTFGSGSSGLILNNYSNKDILMSLSRVAVAVSLVFSYPLAFNGCRDGVMDLLRIPPSKRTEPGLFLRTTVGILAVVTWAALTFKDVSFVLAFGGATLGNALIYVFPALMFRGAVNKMSDDSPNKKQLKREVWFALSSGLLGLVMGAIGAKMAVQSVIG